MTGVGTLALLLVVFAQACGVSENSGDDMDALAGDDDAIASASTNESAAGGGPGTEGPTPSSEATTPVDDEAEPEPAEPPSPRPIPEPMPRPPSLPMNPGFGGGGAASDGGDAGDGGFAFGGSGNDGGATGNPGPSIGGTASGGEQGGAGGAGTGGVNGSTGGSGSGACVPDYDCEPEPPDTGDYYADCVARVNQFRACVCLPPLERNYEAETCMDQQAQYDSELDQAHAGFSDDVCMPRGSSQNECPGWGSATQVVDGCLQQMFDEGPPPQEPCEGQCYQEHGHFINMTDTDITGVACGMYDGDNGFWSVQNFFRDR